MGVVKRNHGECPSLRLHIHLSITTTTTTMFATFTNFIWGENQEEEVVSQDAQEVPGAREDEDWIVVGATPNDLQRKKENSPSTVRNNSKQRLKSLMFNNLDNNSGKNSPWTCRRKGSGWQNQQHKQNLSFK